MKQSKEEQSTYQKRAKNHTNNGFLCNVLSGGIRLSLITKNEDIPTTREAFMKRLR